MSDTTTWSEGSVEELLLSAIIMEAPPSQQQYYLNDDYFDIDEILNVKSPPGSPEVEDTENQTTVMSTTTTTSPSTSTTAHEEPTMDTSEDQAPNINREARAKASKSLFNVVSHSTRPFSCMCVCVLG